MLRQAKLPALLLLVQLLLPLPLLHATPVSSPEIANKSAKSANSVQQLQQQQQQQQLLKSSNQDAHLNSLSAYATSYDSLGQMPQQQAQPTIEAGFKPSYKLPEMETNFTPIQDAQGGAQLSIGYADANLASMSSLPSTPMLMQYLPAQLSQDGSGGNGGGGGGGAVQYLQLIPTRPIIVPISPYLNAANAAGMLQAQAPNINAAAAEYNARAAAAAAAIAPPVQLSTLPAPSAGHVTGLHYAAAGLQGYASAIAPVAAYRSSYRINREAKDKGHFPAAFSLNLNEYLPNTRAGHDAAPAAQLYIRGRS
ncbi:CG14627 [Drosophila busckii]|uniref:CG14627 n=1 Tax=Drosophila busckii TaxID=30019 RepID=A0A0M4EXQ4_DROBS|nr:uncharacterized protein LOC108605007 [Drosophila busckii]ALC48592.1 CG14627 [Drosophila busckii]